VQGLVEKIEQRLGTQVEIVNPLASISYNRKKFEESYLE
jgi:Tfp pilus assembly PilM family ATPase